VHRAVCLFTPHLLLLYLSADGHPSKYWPGPALINFVDAINDVNNKAKPGPNQPRYEKKYKAEPSVVKEAPKMDENKKSELMLMGGTTTLV